MKSFLLATVGLVALVGVAAPASAADMAVKARPPAPVLAPIYDWTGFYIGANGGWGESTTVGISLTRCSAPSLRAAAGVPEASSAARSVIAGKPISGCLAWKPRAIGRISATRAKACSFPALSTRTKTDGIGLFTGQIGYAWNAALLYVKGGAAVTSNRFSIFDNPTGIELASASSTRWGGVVGVGFEYGFAPNWSFGVEYDHLFMGDSNNSFTSHPRLLPVCSTTGSARTWTWLPCASTTASAVTGRRSRPATDPPLVSSKQSLGPGTVPGLFR